MRSNEKTSSHDMNPPPPIDNKLNKAETKQLDEIIDKLEELRNKESVYNDTIIPDKILSKDDVKFLVTKATMIFKQENVLINVSVPVKIFGDIHG
jgi:hypothetical protein